MTKRVFVVTDTELGWDCVVACIDATTITEEDVRKEFKDRTYIITEMEVASTPKPRWYEEDDDDEE